MTEKRTLDSVNITARELCKGKHTAQDNNIICSLNRTFITLYFRLFDEILTEVRQNILNFGFKIFHILMFFFQCSLEGDVGYRTVKVIQIIIKTDEILNKERQNMINIFPYHRCGTYFIFNSFEESFLKLYFLQFSYNDESFANFFYIYNPPEVHFSRRNW